MIRWIVFLVFVIILEIYAFQAFKTLIKSKWFFVFYYVTSAIALAYIIYQLYHFDRSVGQTPQTMTTFGLLLLLYVPKLLLTIILFGEDIVRFFVGLFSLVNSDSEGFLPERRRFVSQIALGIAAIPFASFLYGITIGKYNYKVIRQTLFFPDLPDAFDGTTITHISDVHSGSFDDAEKIQYAIDLINEQNSDMVLFTGDIVNTHATEMDPWIDTFKGIHNPKYGKFSVLGNHDYGEYVDWPSKKDKVQNFENIKSIHNKIDFKLLLNEHVKIKKDNQELAIVGVENWGRKFGERGDLNLASKGLSKEDFKIVMSHDPSHWDEKIQHDDNHYHLTLSGHTHGFQFGIEIPGWVKWSPVQYVYKQWAGLYENAGRYIYVNRGFGFHAYPGRVGIMPEITVIELKKGEKVA
ncbi:metallophosphoesterase [Flavobacterium proteolyticum]|uniref:Metallophosphoesterase n=1 Tax=Flavobacterium proteolyticum TaxID=2911683 RepID=A0ABR9WRS3_9FLAO|nr:metallophosphoesterase [Flavobacterium proteolyticum]MBE9575441.1 metallophosphoesterase [Flavobacterium proteolyticum]